MHTHRALGALGDDGPTTAGLGWARGWNSSCTSSGELQLDGWGGVGGEVGSGLSWDQADLNLAGLGYVDEISFGFVVGFVWVAQGRRDSNPSPQARS